MPFQGLLQQIELTGRFGLKTLQRVSLSKNDSNEHASFKTIQRSISLPQIEEIKEQEDVKFCRGEKCSRLQPALVSKVSFFFEREKTFGEFLGVVVPILLR